MSSVHVEIQILLASLRNFLDDGSWPDTNQEFYVPTLTYMYYVVQSDTYLTILHIGFGSGTKTKHERDLKCNCLTIIDVQIEKEFNLSIK